MSEIRLEGIFPLSIYFGDHFEFGILHFSKTNVYGYPQAYLGSYRTFVMKFLFEFPFKLLVTTGYLVDTSGYLDVTSSYLIATAGYFWLLLVTSRSSF